MRVYPYLKSLDDDALRRVIEEPMEAWTRNLPCLVMVAEQSRDHNLHLWVVPGTFETAVEFDCAFWKFGGQPFVARIKRWAQGILDRRHTKRLAEVLTSVARCDAEQVPA